MATLTSGILPGSIFSLSVTSHSPESARQLHGACGPQARRPAACQPALGPCSFRSAFHAGCPVLKVAALGLLSDPGGLHWLPTTVAPGSQTPGGHLAHTHLPLRSVSAALAQGRAGLGESSNPTHSPYPGFTGPGSSALGQKLSCVREAVLSCPALAEVAVSLGVHRVGVQGLQGFRHGGQHVDCLCAHPVIHPSITLPVTGSDLLLNASHRPPAQGPGSYQEGVA